MTLRIACLPLLSILALSCSSDGGNVAMTDEESMGDDGQGDDEQGDDGQGDDTDEPADEGDDMPSTDDEPVSEPAEPSAAPVQEVPNEPDEATPEQPREPVETPDLTPPEGAGDATVLVGFAAAQGHGLDTTTGGFDGEEVTVTTFDELAGAVSDDEPRIVNVAGTITMSGVDMLDVGSNKTIVGTGGGATLDGFGLDINGWTQGEIDQFDTDTCGPEHAGQFEPTQNVIVQNLIFRNSPDDSVNVQCYTHHVWIDHNTFYSANDGSIDIKRGSDLVTVSWNHFVATEKTMLLGHSADNGEQDRGYLRATYHHNWFDNTATRTPRVRFGYAHVYNNRVLVSDYFLGLGVEATIYAEGNYIEAAKTLTTLFGESVDYNVTWTDTNQYDEETITRAQDMQKTQIDWLDANGRVQAPSEYEYGIDAAEDVDALVPEGAGAGRL